MDKIENYIEVLQNRFKSLVLIGIVSAIFCIVFLNTVTHKYTAFMKIGPVDVNETTNNSNGLGAAAGLIGLNIGGSESASSYLVFQETISSTRLANRLIEKNDPRKVFFGSMYDEENDIFVRPKGFVNWIKNIIKNILGYPDWSEPVASNISTIIENSLIKTSNLDNNFVTYYFEFEDKDFAISFLKDIYEETESLIKEQQKMIASEKKQYYLDALKDVTSDTHRKIISSQIVEQERILSKTGISTPISAMLIDDIDAYPQQTYPKRIQSIFFFVIVGFLSGYIYFVIRDIFLNNK